MKSPLVSKADCFDVLFSLVQVQRVEMPNVGYKPLTSQGEAMDQ